MTSLDPRSIQATNASDLLNVRIEDGALRPRYGYRNLTSPVSNFQGPVRMFDYHSGYAITTPFAEVEEFLSVEKSLNVTRLFTTNPSTGTKAEVKNGTTVVPLDNSEWRSVTWQDSAYLFNANDSNPLYRHKLGDATSFISCNNAAAPGALSYQISYGGGSTPYSTVAWNGLNMSTGVAYTGLAGSSGSVNNNSTIGIAHNINGSQQNTTPSSFEVDLSATTSGVRDWTYNDCLVVTFTGVPNSPFAVNNSTVSFTLTNADGTPQTFVPDEVVIGNPQGQTTYYQAAFRLQFNNKTRASWDNIKKFKVNYQLTARSFQSTSQNLLTVNVYLGGVPIVKEPDPANMVFSATYLNSLTGQESGLSPYLVIPTSQLYGYNPAPNYTNFQGIGVHLQVTVPTTSDANVDKYRLYTDFQSFGNWTHYRTIEQSTRTFTYRMTWAEATSGGTYQPSPLFFTDIVCACAHKGFMAWGYRGQSQTSTENGDVRRVNVRLSRVGAPEALHSDNDDTSDLNRGADFVLADDGDEPQAMHSAGDALIILGRRSAHAMVGQFPSAMTPPKRLPGSMGVANPQASCRWRDAAGNWGVAYLDKWGGLWLAVVDQSFNEAGGYRIEELSSDIRPTLKSFLLDGQSLSDFSTARVRSNEADDSLWIIMGTRAAVLRKPNPVDGRRPWELYSYTLASSATIAYAAFSPKWRARWLRSTGYMDEVDFNTSTNAFITGSNRDGGSAMPTPYWQSKVFAPGANTRADTVQVIRDDYTNTPTVTLTSTFQTGSRTFSSGAHNARFGATQQGYEHTVKVSLGENDSPVRSVQVDILGPNSRRALE